MNNKKGAFLIFISHHSLILIFLTTLLLFETGELRGQKPFEGKSILAVFAHPDD